MRNDPSYAEVRAANEHLVASRDRMMRRIEAQQEELRRLNAMNKSNVIRLRTPPDSYNRPLLILDGNTGLYDIVYQGCVTHHALDVVGEREKICQAAQPSSVSEPDK